MYLNPPKHIVAAGMLVEWGDDLACDRLGIVPAKAVFVGDGGFDELQGAAAVGMRPIQARWYYAREIEWNITSELIVIDKIDDLFYQLEDMVS